MANVWQLKIKRYLRKKNMDYDISKSVSQRGSGEETPENRQINEFADELRRGCQIYETQLRAGQGHVNRVVSCIYSKE